MPLKWCVALLLLAPLVAQDDTTIADGRRLLSAGEFGKAVDFFRKAVEAAHARGDRPAEMQLWGELARTYLTMGALEQSLQARFKELAFQTEAGQRKALDDIAAAYGGLHEDDKANGYFRQALADAAQAGDKRREGRLWLSFSGLYNRRGDEAGRKECLRAAVRAWEAADEVDAGTQDDYRIRGWLYQNVGDLPKAIQAFARMREYAAAHNWLGGEGAALMEMGRSYLDLQQPGKARECLLEAVEMFKTRGGRPQRSHLLFMLARSERALGLSEAAREHILEAIALQEADRLTIPGWNLRTRFNSSIAETYAYALATVLEMGRTDEAFTLAERAHARGLLESLAESDSDIREGADPELIDRERRASKSLDAAAAAQFRLLSGPHTVAQASAAEREVERLAADLGDIGRELRARSPRYMTLVEPEPVSLDQLRREILDPDTVLLEFITGSTQSYLLAVARDSVTSYRIPGSSTLEPVIDRANRLLSRPPQARDADRTALAELSRMILGPAANQLARRRWLVVADGALHYIPFGALPDPNGTPWIVTHEIVNLPSASVLALLRKEAAGRTPAPERLAVFADPVFEARDGRVAGAAGAPRDATANSATLLRSLNDYGMSGLPRLRSTRVEAQRIAALVPGARVSLDFAAARDAVTSPDLSRYRVLHFATHGLLNARHAELSGILLSMVDRKGAPQNGFLQAHEVYNLKLNADLVVLSACRTALGTEVRGEGLVGITRGFMYAGAKRVVASLWPVPDAATAAVMERFYRGMFKQGLTPAAALRAAQAAMRSNPETADPFYWAAFILQGEFR
jgi:CHAT domain-containing protein